MAYKGSISFGLVYIPIKLEPSVQTNDISFNQLDKTTMSRVRYKKTCDDCGDKTVEQKDIVKAYEYEKGKYVVFEDADFEKIKSKRDKNIIIERFVSLDEIDPIYYDKPYYVVPTGAEKAFALLREAMEGAGRVGIAKTVLGTRESVVAVRVRGGEMVLSTLYFNSEIKKNPVKDIHEKVSDAELKLASMIIDNMTGPFEPAKYKDEYTEKVRAAIEAKIAGEEITIPKAEGAGRVIDLMEALQASLKGGSYAPPPG